MKKAALIVLAGLVVLFGVASCSSSTFRSPLLPVSTVTGFARIPLTDGVRSGPVMVRLTGSEAIRLALLLRQLPPVPGAAPAPGLPPSQVHCEQPLGLMYRIVFAAGDGPVLTFDNAHNLPSLILCNEDGSIGLSQHRGPIPATASLCLGLEFILG